MRNRFHAELSPETEIGTMRFRCDDQLARREIFAAQTTIDGNLVTSRNQNSVCGASHRILEMFAAK